MSFEKTGIKILILYFIGCTHGKGNFRSIARVTLCALLEILF